MPFDPNVTYQDAEQARVQKLSIGKQRRIPQFLGLLDEAAKSRTFYIHNVGPWPHRINTGSTGWYNIPGCPKDKDFVTCAKTIDGIVSELTIKDEYEYNRLMDDGARFAGEVAGDGRGRDPAQSHRHYGVFNSPNQIPTKSELAQAKLMLYAHCSEIVREARDLYAMDRKLFSQIVKRERHFAAAEVLNLNDEVWMIEQTPSQRAKCPVCLKMNDEGTMKCGHCGEIIDAVAYRKFKDNQEQILTEPKRPQRG
jgi:ribosomal protein L37AE/L43A